MIFKITTDCKDIEEIVKIFGCNYDILYYGQSFYISEKFPSKRKTCDSIKKKLKNYNNTFIIQIDENNLKYEFSQVQTWCRDKFVEQDLKRFEKEKQPEINEMMETINRFEEEIQKIIDRKEGSDGRRSQEKKERQTS